MEKKLKVLIHIGLGRTGTTWLQANIFPSIKNTLYFGRKYTVSSGSIGDQDKIGKVELVDEFCSYHKKVFPWGYNQIDENSDQYNKDIYKYINYISEKIESEVVSRKSDDYNVIISDENIIGFNSRSFYKNISSLNKIFGEIEERFSKHFCIELYCLVTFREQSSWLQSTFAYDFKLLGRKFNNLNNFIVDTLNNPESGLGYYLSLDKVYRELNNSLDKVKLIFVPFEFLEVDQLKYLQYIFVETGITSNKEIEIYINKNIDNQLRQPDKSFLANKGSIIVKCAGIIHKLQSVLPRKVNLLGKQCVSYLVRIEKKVFSKKIFISNSQKKNIQSHVGDSNARMSKLININLKSLGYLVK